MTKRKVQAIRHIGFEDLGSFQAPLRAAGYEIEYVDVAEQEVASLDPLAADFLVVLGGPIGVNDHAAYPVITDEIELLRARLAADRPTLGICLGAQVMAAALGARVYPGSQKEIGWSPLELTATDTPTLLPRCRMFRFCIGMAIRSICRRDARASLPLRSATTRPFRAGRTFSASSSIQRRLPHGSSIGFWAMRANWRRRASVPSRCAATPRSTEKRSRRPAPACWRSGWQGSPDGSVSEETSMKAAVYDNPGPHQS
ncbi:glutamine amidotransferase-related protein [Endobacterium cereale]|uniref:glutamine amidotransferase-related protein n=1 Tax=Endobacterium cereale TaxID=2663029 RepID=UPI002B4785D2|nr:gamma-glutamyl-gamma-aminobutyrate hydrolase family protein [Endobacterium cereale]MEB2846426.1 gamma-glutamyl-gamma-aminobutyrate hydrolase family protein [Endobacterium cereale]